MATAPVTLLERLRELHELSAVRGWTEWEDSGGGMVVSVEQFREILDTLTEIEAALPAVVALIEAAQRFTDYAAAGAAGWTYEEQDTRFDALVGAVSAFVSTQEAAA